MIKKPNKEKTLNLIRKELEEDIKDVESRIADFEHDRSVLKQRFDKINNKLKLEITNHENRQWFIYADFNDDANNTNVFYPEDD